MAITKQFFFDGDEIREEKVVRDGKDTQRKREAVGNIVHLRGTGVSERPGFVAGKEKQKDLTDMGEISMLVSSLLSKNGKQYARVSLVRGDDVADGIVPDVKLEHVSGFTKEEEAGLKFYLSANKEAILAQAKQIDPLTNWLRMPKKE